MKHLTKTFVLWLLLLAPCSTALAQKSKKLEVEWLARDVKAVELISTLMPIENQSIDSIRSILGVNTGGEEEDLGFGARRFSLGKGNGYTSFYVDAFTLNGAIQYYEVGVRSSSDSWPQIRNDIIKTWKRSGGPEFLESEDGLAYRKTLDVGFQVYKHAVAAELGELKAVDVPADLKDYYDELISPLNNSIIGFGGCGYGGVVPQGKLAIDALMKANRTDLIENVLRGYNPGGRIYAALALLSLKKQGLHLSSETKKTLDKIKSLDIKIETCSGCIVTHRTAKEILEAPEDL
jgi:hypothetical protein